jgi:hypothetical protein
MDDGDDTGGDATGEAEYVFGVRFQLDPTDDGVSVDPQTFETRVYRRADPPGENGWLFFRDNCWRGELADEAHFRQLTEEALDVPVVAVDFRELRTDETYLSSLKAEIAANLSLFNVDSTTEVLSKYLGSSIRVVDGEI